jgi:hypothetical protein
MNDPQLKPELFCRQCGALNDFGSSECWLCQSSNWRGHPGARVRHNISRAPRGLFGSIMGWMVLIALAAVIAGMARTAPGLAIALLFCVLPAWGFTEIKAARRRRRDNPMSGLERVFWIVGLTILIPIVVITALVIALFTFCMLMSR